MANSFARHKAANYHQASGGDCPRGRTCMGVPPWLFGCVRLDEALPLCRCRCELPMAGGAFNFITVTFGEFAGWMVACNLFVEWTLANAAVAKVRRRVPAHMQPTESLMLLSVDRSCHCHCFCSCHCPCRTLRSQTMCLSTCCHML
eukprot:299447-Chlamydomonas_euryale.AAC.7